MRPIIGTILTAAIAACMPAIAFAQADLYSRDTPADTGAEPNPDAGPMWVSEDIWVRNSPDPNYRPVPFTAASPPWTPAAHQSPEYRDPRFGVPNYVYVRVRNRGTATSSGTDQLRLYWAKASTGLAWPASWVDALSTVCGNERLLGAEITKPRVNAATASAADRTLLRDAYLEIATTSAFDLLAGYDYWTKQQQVHRYFPEHDNPAFLPWHREFLNRLEALLQEAKPLTKLMYWNWTTDPAASGAANLYTAGFMGTSGRGISGGTNMGSVLSPSLDPIAADSGSPVVRNLGSGARPAQSDTTITGRPNYFGTDPANNFSLRLEETPNHKSSHTYVAGSMGTALSAARDPFFFLLHGKVDELWARWQRANTNRVEAATAYGTAATNPLITGALRPWNGTGSVDPWTTGGGGIVTKTSFDRSVLSPPIYDTAPLRIPALDPGEAVILEIPWYPPNPAHYSCLGDMRHFCLLSRVTPGIGSEGADVNANVRANNNIVWKNIEVVDDFTGTMAAMSMLVANDTDAPMSTELSLREAVEGQGRLLGFMQSIQVGLPPEIFRRMRADNGRGNQATSATFDARQRKQGVRGLPKETVFLPLKDGQAVLPAIDLAPGERFPLHVVFELKRDYKPTKDPLFLDVVQRRTDVNAVVGGVRMQVDLSRMALFEARGVWRHASGHMANADWTSPRFDDAAWKEAPAPLGFAPAVETMTGVDAGTRTAYFRKRFDVQDPRMVRCLTLRLRHDDGVVVYLNGREVHRANMPDGEVRGDTPATTAVTGAAELAFFPVKLPCGRLRAGANVIAVEVHQAADEKEQAGDMIFDAELLANRADKSEAPSVRIAHRDALVRAGRTMPLRVDAVDPDGQVRKLTLFVDDREVATVDGATGAFDWTPAIGAQRVRVVAEDDAGATAVEDRVVVGVENLPPIIRMQARPGETPGSIVLSADASDDDGQVKEVAFFVADNERFDAKLVPAGTRTTAPFEVTVQLPPTEHRIVTARATDDGGEVGVTSTHVHAGEPHH